MNKTADVLCYGLRAGINYIDCGHNYSLGKAEDIVRIAFEKLKGENLSIYTSVKTMFAEDPSEYAARKRIDSSIKRMGIDHATFGFLWHPHSYNEFLAAAKKGHTLDGLIKARDEGIIEHICVSSHANVKDTRKILESGIFSGCTISVNILNLKEYEDLISFAHENGIGILTMNSLGGGTIPKLNNLIKVENSSQWSLVQTALLKLYQNEGISCMLSTMANVDQVKENTAPFQCSDYDRNAISINFDKWFDNSNSRLCTKCRYCDGCPVNIPIADMMYGYTNRIFTEMMYGYGDSTSWDSANIDDNLMKTKQIFNGRFYDLNAIPKTADNPCIKCGRCEKRCTQKLPIISSIEEVYSRARATNFSHEQRKNRLDEILNKGTFKRVGFFPAGKYTAYIIEAYQNYFGKIPFEVFVFDNNPNVWGNEIWNGIKIYSPNDISNIKPELILVTNFRFGETIFNQLQENSIIRDLKIPVKNLHKKGDIAWF